MAHAAKVTTATPIDISRARLVRRGPGRAVSMSLRSMREAAGLTQAQVSKKSGIAQGEVSKIETATSLDDRQVSTLRRYLAAIGDDLDLVSVSRYGHRIAVAGAHSSEGAKATPAADSATRSAAALCESLARAAADARAFSQLTRSTPDGQDAWNGASQDVEHFARLVDLVATIGKDVSLGCVSPSRSAVRVPKWGLGALRALFEQVPLILRPDRRRGKAKRSGTFDPVDARDLCRDIRDRVPIAAIQRETWERRRTEKKDEPDGLDELELSDDDKEELRALPEGASLAWLTRKGWEKGAIDRLVDRSAGMLERNGHLLDQAAPSDLRERLARELGGQRERASGRKSEGNPENFLRAVLRAYGVKPAKAKSLSRIR
jgi:transcriptional regulator with XRE-family HTH domain